MRLLLLLIWLPSLCAAHHSRSAFDLDATVAVEGEVTEVSWTNPHYYLTLTAQRDAEPVVWTFEGHSVPGLVRHGWTRNTIEVGSRVRVVGHPNRQPEVPFALLDHVTRADGRTFYSFRVPDEQSPQPAPLQASTDFTGTWRLIRSLRNNLVGGFEPPRDWPLTEAARAETADFDLRQDPSLRCEPRGLPRMLAWPYAQTWRRVPQGLRIEIEHATEVRHIFEGGPDGHERGPGGQSVQDLGVSRGERISDDTYVITTSKFPAKHWGLARGVSSSPEKVLTETYRLTEGGFKLDLTYTVSDPQALTEPVGESLAYAKVADYAFAEEPPCDVRTARRHLEFEP